MLLSKLQEDYLQAMKDRNSEKVNVLRTIKSELKYLEIEKKRNLTDQDALNVVIKQAKKLRDSLAMFEKGGRRDLVLEVSKQLEIIADYLPKQLSIEEIKQEIEKIKTEYAEIISQNPKALVGLCMRQLKGKATPEEIMQCLG